MRNILAKFFLLFLLVILSDCTGKDLANEYPEFFNFKVTNKLERERKEACVFLDIEKIKEKHPDFNPEAFVIIKNKKELPSQSIRIDNKEGKIIFLDDFSPNEIKNLSIRYAKEGNKRREYAKRTQSILSIKSGGKWDGDKYEGGTFKDTNYLKTPPQYTDHSEFIRFEGPGWESDRVGYRLYLDWRNGLDIFGKKVNEMVLQSVGLDGYESYHEMSDWGMDILKVGDALGIGSIGIWEKEKVERVSKTDSVICSVTANGPVYSSLRIQYLGWQTNSGKYDVTSELSIAAASRLTKHNITVNKDIPNLCTGIVKSEGIKIIKSKNTESDWAYLASYGNQSIIGDKLGMAIIYRKKGGVKITEDDLNNVVVLKTENGQLTYYFLAAWEQEAEGIKSEEEFTRYLEGVTEELNSPILIEIMQ